MVVAGCINAYDCSGNLIRTLEQLQSSNIGVGVQYTAPNPLDDKKIDYIKYTDKCGCTCCLTGENEILIYATNGVIKNLTLTNDDVNEAVVVKWNDIFGSNRAKTVVRYKTGSAPISPTDGTLAVEETTKNQYSTNGFSVTGLSDSTTYYFSVFALDIDGTMIDVQNDAITTSFGYIPDGNTLFYIKNDGNISDYSQYSHAMNRRGSSSFYTLSNGRKVLDLSSSNGIFSNQFTEANNKTNFTLHCWMKLKSTPSNDWILGGWCGRAKSDSGTSDKWGARFQKVDNYLKSGVLIGNGTSSWGDGSSYEIDCSTTEFVLLSMTINGGTLKTYRNGTLLGTQSLSSIRGGSSTGPRFYLGGAVFSDGTYWDGGCNWYIGESVLEDKTESDAEVLNFYNKTKNHYV